MNIWEDTAQEEILTHSARIYGVGRLRHFIFALFWILVAGKGT